MKNGLKCEVYASRNDQRQETRCKIAGQGIGILRLLEDSDLNLTFEAVF